jgi:hypothetical protein
VLSHLTQCEALEATVFDNRIDFKTLDVRDDAFAQMTTRLGALVPVDAAARSGQITSQDVFPLLHEATKDFYCKIAPDIYYNFVPLFHSVWKHTVSAASGRGNMHQDGGVHYFAKNGYASRMINTWICLEKSLPPALPPDELGLYVVETRFAQNEPLYRELLRHNIHVASRPPAGFVDNMQVAGARVEFPISALRLTTFPYDVGTMITFSSHLLHGSKSCDERVRRVATPAENCYRVALSSVWLHSEDLDHDVLELPGSEIDSLFLWRHDRAMWPQLQKHFEYDCDDERKRIVDIKRLIQIYRHSAADRADHTY